MITGLHHGNLVVSDLDRAKKFYTEVLGLHTVLETEIDEPEFDRGVGIPGTKVRALFLAIPNSPTQIEIFQYVAPHKSKPRPADALPSDIGFGHLAFLVDDIDAVHRRLAENKVPFVSSPVRISDTHKDCAGIRFCYLSDPDGTIVELIYIPR